MIKKLLFLSRLFFSKQNQKAPEIIATKLFGNTAKLVCFAFFAFQMGFGQSCNVVTNSTFTGNANGWTFSGSGTGWYYESNWAPNEIYIEKDGATDQSLKQNLTGLIGNSLSLTFKIKGQNANRLSSCPTTATLVIKLRGVTYMTITNGPSNSQITTGNIATSNGATYTQSGFPLTVGGATSAISLTQGTITLTIPWVPATATSADLEFLATTSNTASGSCLAWGGDDWFLDDIMLYASNPTAYNMTGTSVCAGSTTTVGLSNSQLGVNYQLMRNGSTAVGSPVSGTGSAISFGSQSITGVYTAVATAGNTNCATPMNGSVSINPNPTLTGAAQPAAQPAVCEGSAATINLTGLLPNTTSTINYTINGIAQTAITGVISNASGAGSFTTTALTIANNGQILQITGVTNTSATPNCTTSFARNVTLAVNSTPTLTGAVQSSTVCAGSGATITLSGLLASSTSTINYTINGIAQAAISGVVANSSGIASFISSALTAPNHGQILQITGVTTTSATPSCSASFTQNVTLTVNPSLPVSVSIAASPAGAICTGTSVTFTATPTNGGTAPVYQWRVNGGIVGTNSPTYSNASLADSNTVTCTITSNATTCLSGNPATSNTITMIVNTSLSAATITPNTAQSFCPSASGSTLTLTPTGGGVTTYQWGFRTVSGGTVTPISGATASTYTPAFTDLGSGTKYIVCTTTPTCGSVRISNEVTISITGPTATGVSICVGGSGSLSSSYSCTATGVQTATGSGGVSNTTAYGGSGNTNISINFPALPVGAVVTTISTTITYTSNNPSYTNELRIQATPPVSLGGVQTDLEAPSTSSSPGTITNGAFGTWGTANPAGTWLFRFRETYDDNGVDANISNISIIVNYTIPGTLDWYTVATGGTIVESGNTFNPINDPQVIAQGGKYSSLSNTNTPDTYTFYAACPSNPNCRTPVNFVINAKPTVTFDAQPGATACVNTDVAYTTQPGQSNYIWGIPGVLNTNYSITSGGTFTDNSVTLKWLTTGSRTVTINYTNPAGCSANTATSSTTTMVNANASLASVTGAASICIGGAATQYVANTVVLGGGTGTWSSSNTAVATVDPSGKVTGVSAGTTNITYTITGGCSGTKSAFRSITVNPNLLAIVSISASPAGAICSGTNVTFTATATNGGSPAYQWKVNGVDAGTNSSTFATTTLANSDVVTVVMTSNATPCLTGSPATSNSLTMTVNPTPTAPTVGTTTHISCTANTGSVVLGNLPTGNWTINQTGSATASYSNTIANTTSTTISGLAAGSYTFTVTNASGCPSPASTTVTILDNSNTWNGSSWSKGVQPDASMNVIIASVTPSSPFTVDLVGCALTINSGVVATVPSGITLTITNEVTVNGSLTFENNSSLVQINDVNNNSGPITYKRNSQPMK
ncbi:beta strand repeat-containing protein, partial [Flavobacterium sp. W22_SRS_FK3]|uniref:beta strand repeat-containing protein n=1 Tax=Flavobacterium sp. W22_SRS_FK3 TaxID=3240275 RepID=UPI003F91719C